MAAGSIVVDLMARTGSFDTDIQRSTKAAEKRMKEMQQTASEWGSAIGVAFTAAATAGALMAKNLIDGLDKLNDVADATGASVENISALEDAALRTGNSFESVEAALIKFNMALKGTDDDGKAARALSAIGLSADDLRKLDPAEALRQTAVALSKFADDGDKARLVQELFGKSVREVGPFLKDLAEKTELVGTVTGEQAKQAEAFNHQLAEISKNSVDAKRALLSDLLPALNATIRAMREGGGLMGFFMTGGGQTADPGKALNDVSGKLQTLRKDLAAIESLPNVTRTINQAIWGDETDLKAQIATLEKQQKYLQSLQRTAAVEGLGDTSDAQSRRLGAMPSVGPIAEKAKKGPKGPDPDADFKSYLDNLQKQIQKTGELTVSEKLLDDIRRGSLTVSAEQEKRLKGLAAEIDSTKEAIRVSTERAALRKKDNEEAEAAARQIEDDYAARLRAFKDAGPESQIAKRAKEIEFLNDALAKGKLDAQGYADAINGLSTVGGKVAETKTMTEQLGMTFESAFEKAAAGGGSLSDVFKGLLQDIAKVILRMQVMEPMMKALKGGMGGGEAPPANPYASGGGGGGIDWAGMFSSVFGGSYAAGGDPPVGKVSLVGERGPELFVPRTAGSIVPNHAMGGDKVTVINQTTGRVDKVVEQRISPTERALILQENRELIAADLQDPNSRLSRSMGRAFSLSRNR